MLLLDEPSNDLDIATVTILEDYLNSFDGIVIAVSHDRYFLDNVADRIFELDGQGNVKQYEGGYTDYLNARKEKEKEKGKKRRSRRRRRRHGKKPRQEKLKFSYKEQKEYESIDDEIAALEEKTGKAGSGYDAECHQFHETDRTDFRKGKNGERTGRKNGPLGLSE